MLKAIVAEIEYAGLKFEGLMLPDGSYGIALSQICKLFLEWQKASLKRVESNTGLTFESGKDYVRIATELNNKKSVVIKLDCLSRILMVFAFKGHVRAQNFILACTLEKLERIFDKAFDKQVAEEERENRFKKRMQFRKDYHPSWTIWGKEDGLNGWQYGKRTNDLKRKLGLPLINIDDYTGEQLDAIVYGQKEYDNYRRKLNMSHEQAFKLL